MVREMDRGGIKANEIRNTTNEEFWSMSDQRVRCGEH